MRGTLGIWIGLVVVAINALVFIQDWNVYRAAAPGAGASFPFWQALVLVGACVYLVTAGILYDRARRTGRR